MTNPTPHGQVPETLIDLIDAYAETRHRCGGISNARTEAARNAVIEALSGVQALSAAPAVPTSVKGAMWFTKKPVTIQAIQWTGENLREVIMFTDGPPDTRSHHAGMAWDAYRDLVARDGLKIYTLEGKMLASPGDWIIRGVKGEHYPCKDEIFRLTYAAASPTPPAELEAVGAGGVSGPLMGRASLSANAGEPVAWQYRSLRDNGAWFDCTKERFEMRCTQPEIWETRALYAAPPTAQAEGWQSIETAPKGELVLLWSEITRGKPFIGDWAEYARYNHPQFTHWSRWDGPPPTSAEGVEHG